MTKPKQLQHDSIWNLYDTDNDGIVTDDELDRSERMMQIENMDKLQDQQRYMAWFALGLPVFLMIFMMMPFVPVDKVGAVMGIATTFVAAMGTIVTVFIGGTAYVKGKMSDSQGAVGVAAAAAPKNFVVAPPAAPSAATSSFPSFTSPSSGARSFVATNDKGQKVVPQDDDQPEL